MIVPVTPHNSTIYEKLCDIDVAFTNATSPETREGLIAEALELCKELELN